MLEDNKQESQLLGEEVDQLKLLLKREVSLMKGGGGIRGVLLPR